MRVEVFYWPETGQRYERTGLKRVTTRDGRQIHVTALRSWCADCRKEFELTSTRARIAADQLNRRCQKCKKPGVPVALGAAHVEQQPWRRNEHKAKCLNGIAVQKIKVDAGNKTVLGADQLYFELLKYARGGSNQIAPRTIDAVRAETAKRLIGEKSELADIGRREEFLSLVEAEFERLRKLFREYEKALEQRTYALKKAKGNGSKSSEYLYEL